MALLVIRDIQKDGKTVQSHQHRRKLIRRNVITLPSTMTFLNDLLFIAQQVGEITQLKAAAALSILPLPL
jgi:hypothetical protein